MRRDPLDEGRRWLEQARHDLHWAQDLAERGGYHIACFLAQQVAEKALKAFLYSRGLETVLGHSVQRLAVEVESHDPDLGERARAWVPLDGYYIPTRYPNGLPDGIPALAFTREVAEQAVGHARDAVDEVGRRIDAAA